MSRSEPNSRMPSRPCTPPQEEELAPIIMNLLRLTKLAAKKTRSSEEEKNFNYVCSKLDKAYINKALKNEIKKE